MHVVGRAARPPASSLDLALELDQHLPDTGLLTGVD
jgi:hypothetical protein